MNYKNNSQLLYIQVYLYIYRINLSESIKVFHVGTTEEFTLHLSGCERHRKTHTMHLFVGF